MREMVWKRVEIEGSWDSTRTASTVVERTRPVMALAASKWTISSLLVVVADCQEAQAAAAYIQACNARSRCRPVDGPKCASQSTEEVDAAGYRLAELSHMLSNVVRVRC